MNWIIGPLPVDSCNRDRTPSNPPISPMLLLVRGGCRYYFDIIIGWGTPKARQVLSWIRYKKIKVAGVFIHELLRTARSSSGQMRAAQGSKSMLIHMSFPLEANTCYMPTYGTMYK